MQQHPATLFNRERAASYDKHTDLWISARDAMFTFMRLIFADLPDDAHILCVGVGTGTELISLAQHFPDWRFTAVEPAPAMLDVCRQKVEENGLTSRCTFHEGFLDSLPTTEPFDGATCLLVSHFFNQSEQRCDFFRQISSRLKPGAILISSDLMLGQSPPVYESLFEVWVKMLGGSGWSEEQINGLRTAYGRDIAKLMAPQVESIIEAGGFETPVLFFQTLFICAWFSRRAA